MRQKWNWDGCGEGLSPSWDGVWEGKIMRNSSKSTEDHVGVNTGKQQSSCLTDPLLTAKTYLIYVNVRNDG